MEPPVQNETFIEQARRRQIVEATIASVAAEGYAGASLAKVAARANISKSVVVYYFGGKDALLETAVRQIYAEIWDCMRPRFVAETTARGKLLAYLESEFAFLAQHRDRLLAISHILPNHRDRQGSLYLLAEAEKVNLAMLGGLLEKGQAEGEFRPFAIRPMAVTLMQAINGALGQWVADPAISLSDYARELATLFDLATRK